MKFLSWLPCRNRFLIASGNGGCCFCICRGRRLAANVIWQRRKILGFCGLFSRLLYYYVFRAVVEPCRLAALPDNNSIRGNYLYPSSPLACRPPLLNYGLRVGGAIWEILLRSIQVQPTTVQHPITKYKEYRKCFVIAKMTTTRLNFLKL